ncbi:GntR family transcriptional regulator [Paenibacillus urinalis]|uniref:GntR family transcriptional regulator n=1 Tax=Paenibacillus urinalis TaxID=521520 RepID=UPI0036437B6C
MIFVSLSRKKGPLYLQLKKIIRDRIVHGQYPVGTLIPSEPQLEQEFAVSKMTVRNAIKELQQEGYVLKQSGVGTTVQRNSVAPQLSKGKQFTEILVEQGETIYKRLVGKKMEQNSPDSKAHALFGDHCLCLERLYLLNDQPFIYYEHRLPLGLAEAEDWNVGDEFSLYEWLEDHHLVAEQYRDQFTVAPLSARIASELGMSEGDVVLRRQRFAYTEDGRAVEWSIGYYNTMLSPYIVNYQL